MPREGGEGLPLACEEAEAKDIGLEEKEEEQQQEQQEDEEK